MGVADYRRRVLLIASVSSFLVYLDVTVVNIAFPEIEGAFPGTSRESLIWILSAYNITFAALLLPAGRLADRLGRKRVFLAGLGGFVGASMLCALAPSAGLLIAARVLQALGGAALVPAAQGLILGVYEGAERTRAISLWVAAAAVAAALGPPLGGVLVDLGSWRWVFAINLPLGLLAYAAGRRVLRESREVTEGPLPDPLGVGMIAAAVGLLTLAIVQGGEWGWASPAVLGAFAGAFLLGPLVVARCRRHPVPAIDLSLFASPVFSIANAASVLIGVAFYGQLFAAVLFLTGAWGYGPLQAGLALVPAPVMAAAAAALAGRGATPRTLVPLALLGAGLFAAGALWLRWRLGLEPAYLTEMLPGTILVGIGGGLAVSLLAALAAQVLPEARYAVGSAVNSATRQIGAALGVAGVVAALGTPGPAGIIDAFQGVWLLIAAAALAAVAVVATVLTRSRELEPLP